MWFVPVNQDEFPGFPPQFNLRIGFLYIYSHLTLNKCGLHVEVKQFYVAEYFVFLYVQRHHYLHCECVWGVVALGARDLIDECIISCNKTH